MAQRRYGFKDLVVALVLLRAAFLAYFLFSGGETLEPDSPIYLALSDNLASFGWFSRSAEVFAPEVLRTPGYPLVLSLFSLLGVKSVYWISVTQEIIYLGTALLFYRGIKRLLDERIAQVTTVFLLVEPGSLAYPKFIISEVLFLPFIVVALLLAGFYFRDGGWHRLLVAGILLGLATMIRPAATYLPLLFGAVIWLGSRHRTRAALHAGVMVLAFLTVLSPWLFRNYAHFDSLYVSGQTSNMLANYHVPIVWESTHGRSFEEGRAMMQRRVAEAAAAEVVKRNRPLDSVDMFQLQQSMAIEELARQPSTYAKQWFYGVLKTVLGSNVTEVYHAIDIRADRLRYSDIVEPSFVRKVLQFLIHQDPLVWMDVVLRGILAVCALMGAWAIVRSNEPFLWIILLANVYFVFIPGPMGHARFRFPVEGFIFIQAWLGLGLLGLHFGLSGLKWIRYPACAPSSRPS